MSEFVRTTMIWVTIAFLGDAFVAPAITVWEITPNFSLIALVVLALARGSAAGCLGGFVLGLVQDLASPHLLGLRALCKTLIGFLAGRLRGHLVYGLPIVEGLVVASAALVHDLLFLLVQSRLSDDAFLGPLITHALPGAIYSGLVGIPLIRLADLLGILRQEQ